MNKLKNLLASFIPILILELSVVIVVLRILVDTPYLRFNRWVVADWMINYQSGFVRRGLFGELLHQLNSNSMVAALYPMLTGLFIGVAILFAALYFYSKAKGQLLATIILLIPGGIFHMAISGDFYSRKEGFFEIQFGILCLLYIFICKNQGNIKSRLIDLFCFFAVPVGMLMELGHEAYLFMSFPIFCLLIFLLAYENPSHRLLRWSKWAYLILIPALFVVASLNHGSYESAQVIWEAVPLADRIQITPASPYTVSLAAGAIAWTMQEHFLTIYENIVTNQLPYIAFFFCGNLLIVLFLASRLRPYAKPNGENEIFANERYVRLLALAFIGSLGMFFLGSDWGRWIACAVNQWVFLALALRFSPSLLGSKFQCNHAKFLDRISDYFNQAPRYLFVTLILVYSLVYQMPESVVGNYRSIYIPYFEFGRAAFEIIRLQVTQSGIQ